jgi:hypothetical protein
MVPFANVTGPHPETGSGMEAPSQFSVVPEVVAALDQEKKNQDRNPHRRYPTREETGTVTSTAVANAGGG